MSQRSGFFNAILMPDGKYDRKYNADDYSDNLAVIISDGVARSSDDALRCVADGMNVNVNIGRGWIRGKWYINDSLYNFVVPTPSTVNPRKDRVFLRFDKNVSTRDIFLYYAEGTPAQVPVPPTPQDTSLVKDLVLCEIDVPVNATSVTVTDTRADSSLCGWVYSVKGDDEFFKTLDNDFYTWFDVKKDTLASVTIFKKYVYRTTTYTEGQTVVTFNIPQYNNNGHDILEVYFNGRLQVEGEDYILGESLVTFTTAKTAGQEVTFKCWKSIDGTGLETIVDRMTAVENKVDTLGDITEYNYICNGADDNVKLSEIAQAFLTSADDGKTMTVNVYGTVGCSAPYSGAGTTDDPFKWFAFGTEAHQSRRICFDFGNTSRVDINCTAGTHNVLFAGHNVCVKNGKIRAYCESANSSCIGFNSLTGNILVESCTIIIFGYENCYISVNGTFEKCSVAVHNKNGLGRCYIGKNGGILRINDGDALAYSATGRGSAVVFVDSAETTATVITNGLSCPTLAKSGYSQAYAIYDVNATGNKNVYFATITTLQMLANSQTVLATIATNKTTGVW